MFYYFCHVLLCRDNLEDIILINIDFNGPGPYFLGRFEVRPANVGPSRGLGLRPAAGPGFRPAEYNFYYSSEYKPEVVGNINRK